MSVPVVIAANGLGVPVRPVEANAPVLTIVANGLGIPIVISDMGAPFIVEGLEPPWSPLDLFAGAQPGYWPDGYDPADGRLFQNNNGTVPTMASGQAVGLALDLTQGGGEGPELAANPGDPFASASSWTMVGGGATDIVDGDIRLTRSASTTYIYQLVSTVAGRHYGLDWSARPGTANSSVSAGGNFWESDLYSSGTISSPSSLKAIFRAVGASTALRFTALGTVAGSTCYLSKSSLRELFGHHAAQATALSRPTLTLADGRYHLYNDGGDSLPVTLPAGTYGLAYIDAAGAITVTTITDPTDTLYAERQVDVILRQGAFSPAEDALIRDYWSRYQ